MPVCGADVIHTGAARGWRRGVWYTEGANRGDRGWPAGMNFTVADILGVGAGFVLFGLFGFAPGYTFGWVADVFQFRERRLATRVALAVPLSIGLMPITAYLLWHVWVGLVWVVFGACGLACAVLLARDWRRLGLRLSRAGWAVAAIAAGWVVLGTFSLIDLQFGKRLYFPVSDFDHMTRMAFTAAIARDGVPPHNPFFFAGQPGLLRYHYFWFVSCALVDRLGGRLVTPRMSVIDGVLWSGLGLLAVIALYLRFFQARGGEQIERRTLIACSLLGVMGLDIVPVLLVALPAYGLLPWMEYWNNAIWGWVSTVLWVPHDVAGLTAGLTGFLLVWEAVREERKAQRRLAFVVGGVAFGSSVGLSVYLGGTVAVCCALWLGICVWKRWWRHAVCLAGAGVIAGILLLPWMLQILHGPHAGNGGHGGTNSFPFKFGMRAFTMPDALVPKSRPGILTVVNTVLLPLNYFMEFGFYLVVGWLGVWRLWRRRPWGRADWGAALLGTGSTLICTFVSSTVIANNDLGWRSALVVQFVLLLLAAEMWSEGTIGFGWREQTGPGLPRRTAPVLVSVTLVLGVMGSCYEVVMQRTYPMLIDAFPIRRISGLSAYHQLGRQTYAMRSAYEELNRMLPANAVVQADPKGGIGNVPAELYSGRQMVADVGGCGTVFGGSAQYCEDVILPQLKPLFDDRRAMSLGDAEKVCREFSITALLFEDTDPVWKDKSSWIWQVTPMIGNDYVRVIGCDGGVDRSGDERAQGGGRWAGAE